MQPISRKYWLLDGTKARHFSFFFLPRPIGSRLKPSQRTASSYVAQVRMLLFSDSILPSHEGKQTSPKMLTIGSFLNSIHFEHPKTHGRRPSMVRPAGSCGSCGRFCRSPALLNPRLPYMVCRCLGETFTRSFQAEASTVIYLLLCTVYVYKKQQCNNMYVLYCFICIGYIYLSESK